MKKLSSNREHIPHNRLTIGKEEEEAAVRVLRSGWLAQGAEVEAFEQEICQFLNIPKGSAVAVSSGTAGLYLSLVALRAIDTKVAIPIYTCAALRHAVKLARANPLLTDSRPNNPNIDISQSKGDIAIVPHMLGIPQAIQTYTGRIIEDCAQAIGATINSMPVGLQGDIGIFSFYATKLFTSGGQGGMIVSKNEEIIQFVKNYRLFDQQKDEKERFNFQMTDLQAAIGRIQLQKLPQFLQRRAEIYEAYKRAGIPLLDGTENTQPVRFRAVIHTENQTEVIEALQRNNIKAAMLVESRETASDIVKQFPAAYYWATHTVSLPIYPTLRDEEVARIISVVTNVL